MKQMNLSTEELRLLIKMIEEITTYWAMVITDENIIVGVVARRQMDRDLKAANELKRRFQE